jgi:hypothetical protein
MVDINLFDDEPEEKKQQNGDQSFDNLDGGEDLDLGSDLTDDLEADFNASTGEDELGGGEDSIDEALGFDEEFTEDQGLEPDDLMDEEFTELDDEAGLDTDDYDYGGGGHKQVTPLLWIIVFLAIIVIAFVFYRDPIVALFTSKANLAKKIKTTQTTELQGQKTPQSQTGPGGPAALPDSFAQSTAAMQSGASLLLRVSAGLFEDLSSKGQFNMMMVDNDRFAVEYVANVKGTAESFSQHIKTLVNATSVVASPEDAHSVNGKTVYFGVISGKLDPAVMKRKYSGSAFSSEDGFINAVKSQIQQYGLKESGYKKRSARQEGSQTKNNYEFIVEGERVKAIAFLKSLNTLQGAWEPVKIRLSPLNLNDFSAMQVKLVLDLAAITGSAQVSSAQPGY